MNIFNLLIMTSFKMHEYKIRKTILDLSSDFKA